MNSLDQRIEHIVHWLQSHVAKTKANGLLVGISGGVDSAVVAFLIKRAFPDRSLGVIMPCHSNPKDEDDALKVVKACGIDHMNIDLSKTHDILLGTVLAQLKRKEDSITGVARLVDGNLRARLRMAALYTVANHYNYLVVGTDNAAEMYTGYFTKYGDGGVDLLPLARLLKREVYRFAEHLGVPKSVLERPPSAGLWVGQEDEQEMNTTYDKIDDFLAGLPIPEADKRTIERMHERSEHKRHMPPILPEFPE